MRIKLAKKARTHRTNSFYYKVLNYKQGRLVGRGNIFQRKNTQRENRCFQVGKSNLLVCRTEV